MPSLRRPRTRSSIRKSHSLLRFSLRKMPLSGGNIYFLGKQFRPLLAQTSLNCQFHGEGKGGRFPGSIKTKRTNFEKSALHARTSRRAPRTPQTGVRGLSRKALLEQSTSGGCHSIVWRCICYWKNEREPGRRSRISATTHRRAAENSCGEAH